MTRTRRLTLLAALTALLLAVVATPAEAAKRTVPFGFFGTVMPPEMSYASQVGDAALDQQMGLMAQSGVESARPVISWKDTETAPGFYNWSGPDRLIRTAARHGLALLPTVIETPAWASQQPAAPFYWRYAPRDPQTFANFARQLVQRYGPRGSFWAQNPGLPRVPVRNWQLYNEQMANFFWASQPWPATYTRVLKAAYRAVHSADRGAKVVAGSLVAVNGISQWAAMRSLYRAGAKGSFDVIAVHPFTNNPRSLSDTMNRMVEIIQRVRTEMNRRGDRRKSIILTELTWPAAIGRVPNSRLLGLETTTSGQVARLKAAYRRLAKDRRKLNVTQAFWFTWATAYDANTPAGDVTYRFAGLTRFTGGVFSRMPILGTYASVAAKYEGCRKSSSARRCR